MAMADTDPATPRHPWYDEQLRDSVREAVADGLSVRGIAERVGRSPTRVTALLNEMGLKTNPPNRKGGRLKGDA